jgi:hypothetical protein
VYCWVLLAVAGGYEEEEEDHDWGGAAQLH